MRAETTKSHGRERRDFWFSRAERRGEDYDSETSHGVGVPYGRNGSDTGHGTRRSPHEGANWIPSRAALFLRLPDRARTAEVLRAVVRRGGQSACVQGGCSA